MKRIIAIFLTLLFVSGILANAQPQTPTDPIASTIVMLLKQGKSFPKSSRFEEYSNASCPLAVAPSGRVVGVPYSICISDDDASGYKLYLASWREELYEGHVVSTTVIYCLLKKGNTYYIDNLYIADYDYNVDTDESRFKGYKLARDYSKPVEYYWES